MKSIIRLLPIECTPDLTQKQKNLLLKQSTFELPGGDSLERIEYSLDTPVLKNYASFQFNYTTGQSGFGIFELKRLKTTAGIQMIIFSRYGGARTLYSQDTLKIFTLSNGRLVEDKEQRLLPQSIDYNEFLKKKTPDSIRKRIESYTNRCYFLDPEKPNQVEFNLYTSFMGEELNDWLLGDSFIFTWNGRYFKRRLAFSD